MNDTGLLDVTKTRGTWDRAAAYDAYADGLHTYCLSLLRDHGAAARALHDVFVLADAHADRLSSAASASLLQPWLYGIARAECLLSVRRSETRRRGPAGAGDAGAGDAGARATAGANQSGRTGHDDLAAVPQDASLRDLERTLRRAELSSLGWRNADGVHAEHREALELTVRHGLAARDLGLVLGLSPERTDALLTQAWRALHSSTIGVALADRGGCPDLDVIRDGWQGRMTHQLCRRVLVHAERCRGCRPRAVAEATRVASPSLLALVPAPRSLRRQILGDLSDPGQAEQRARVAAQLTDFTVEGFAVQPERGRHSGGGERTSPRRDDRTSRRHAGPPDAGVRDAGVRDAGVRDAGVRDGGVRDGGVRDRAAGTGAADAAVTAPIPAVPQAPNPSQPRNTPVSPDARIGPTPQAPMGMPLRLGPPAGPDAGTPPATRGGAGHALRRPRRRTAVVGTATAVAIGAAGACAAAFIVARPTGSHTAAISSVQVSSPGLDGPSVSSPAGSPALSGSGTPGLRTSPNGGTPTTPGPLPAAPLVVTGSPAPGPGAPGPGASGPSGNVAGGTVSSVGVASDGGPSGALPSGAASSGRLVVTTAAGAAANQTVIVLTNTGGTELPWSAAVSASYASLDATSGVLAPGAAQRVTVTIDPDRAPAGHWSVRITLSPGTTVVTIQGDTSTSGALPAPPPTSAAPAPPSSGGGSTDPGGRETGPGGGRSGAGVGGPTDPPPASSQPPSSQPPSSQPTTPQSTATSAPSQGPSSGSGAPS